ncbi:MAG: STAS/SEC14 domain-containing protein [Sulfurimonadaceae bacterium]
MVNVDFDEKNGIVILTPSGVLHSEDIANVAEMVDPYIAEHGELGGLIIYTREFPGWEDFSALVTHIKFVKDHHKHIAKVALVSDMAIADFTKNIVKHFVNAEVATFHFNALTDAKKWMMS